MEPADLAPAAAGPPYARVWLIDVRRDDTYHLERAYLSDYLFEDHTLRSWVGTPVAPAELRARARRLGIIHLLVRHDVPLRYDRAALVERPDQKFVLAALRD